MNKPITEARKIIKLQKKGANKLQKTLSMVITY